MENIIGVRPLKNRILVDIYDDGSKPLKLGGKLFWTPSDDKFGPDTVHHVSVDQRHPGIRPRWAIVVGTSQEAHDDGIRVGQKVLLEQMKWSRGLVYDEENRKKVWSIDYRDVIGIDNGGFDEEEVTMLEHKYPDHV